MLPYITYIGNSNCIIAILCYRYGYDPIAAQIASRLVKTINEYISR